MIVEGALIDSGIEVQCVRGEHVWVGGHGLRGGGGGTGYEPGPLNALFSSVESVLNWQQICTSCIFMRGSRKFSQRGSKFPEGI